MFICIVIHMYMCIAYKNRVFAMHINILLTHVVHSVYYIVQPKKTHQNTIVCMVYAKLYENTPKHNLQCAYSIIMHIHI